MKNIKPRKIQSALAGMFAVSLISACSGDGRPLQEAVEINDLELQSISIRQPARFLSNLVVNTGERITFDIDGLNQFSEVLPLDSEGRRWRVLSSESVADGTNVESVLASIDEDGNFVATNQGDVVVRVQIGPLAANFPVQISDETLVSISRIEGDDTVERCIPRDYYAVGLFSGNSERALPNATWGVDNPGLGVVTDANVNGDIALIGRNPGAIALVASVGTISAQKVITVADTLQSIVIEPDVLSLEEDAEISVTAEGIYAREGSLSQIGITQNVIWSLPPTNDVATISNTAPNIGVITSVNVGSTVVTATCGGLRQDKAVVVVDDDSDDS